jgi:hypothetical protein
MPSIRRLITKSKASLPAHCLGRDHGQGELSRNLWDTAYGPTPDIRQRPLHDEAMTCGNQPANIRVINRRFNDPASNNDLEDINYNTSFKP